jgi:hypothetical protein
MSAAFLVHGGLVFFFLGTPALGLLWARGFGCVPAAGWCLCFAFFAGVWGLDMVDHITDVTHYQGMFIEAGVRDGLSREASTGAAHVEVFRQSAIWARAAVAPVLACMAPFTALVLVARHRREVIGG